MNKSLLFILLIVLAGGILWTVDYFSSVPPSDEIELGGIVQEPKVVRDFKSFCDTLSESKWDQDAFQERIDRLNVYRAKNIVNASEFLNLEEYMYSAYASSLINSYTEWKQSCDAAKLKPMHTEMKRLSGLNSGCANKLKASQQEINGFYALLGMPNKINQLTRTSYSENQFNKLKKEIAGLPNDFRSCSNVNGVKQKAESDLNSFQKFVVNYNDAMNAYQMNAKDAYTLRDLKKLCSQAKEKNYSYYVSQFNEKRVCY
jgi:hypothetical protein